MIGNNNRIAGASAIRRRVINYRNQRGSKPAAAA
jgi:hypothetical protein